MSPQVSVQAVIFDLGDVLFQWSANTKTTISAKTLRKLLSTPAWFEYECGRITRDECYENCAQEFNLEASQIAEAFAQARESLQPDDKVVAFIRALRKAFPVKVYAMSNVAKEDFAALSEKTDWSLFDRAFPSGHAGMRKPDPAFFRYVLEEIQLPPEQVVFVDDKQENVQAAESLGIRGIVFDDSTVQTLHTLFDSPVARGYEYLYRNAGQFDSITDSGIVVPDNFAQLLILEATKDRNLVRLTSKSKETWNFFAKEATLVPGGYFPDDLDTTSLALTVLQPQPAEVVTTMLDKMAEYVNPDGTFLTYFDREKPRTDTVVSANVLACFYRFGRGDHLKSTLQLVHDVLLNRTYMQGTRYYPTPDCCLGFFVRLLQLAKNKDDVQTTLGPLVKSRVEERVGQSGSALDLAMRVIACDFFGIECDADRQALLRLQCEDGSFEIGWMYRYGSTGVKIGNRGVTTAMAVKALGSLPKAAPAVNGYA